MEEKLVGRFLDRAIGEGRVVQYLLRCVGLARNDEACEPDRESHQVDSFQRVSELGERLVGGGRGEGEKDAGGAGDLAAVGPGEGPSEASGAEEEEGDDENGGEEKRGERDDDWGNEKGEVEFLGRHFYGRREMGRAQKTILVRNEAEEEEMDERRRL